MLLLFMRAPPDPIMKRPTSMIERLSGRKGAGPAKTIAIAKSTIPKCISLPKKRPFVVDGRHCSRNEVSEYVIVVTAKTKPEFVTER